MITIKYDNEKVTDNEIVELSKAIKDIVSEAAKIPEVFVYADSPHIRIAVAPIEVFIEMSASKIVDTEKLFQDIRNKLSEWKQANSFECPVTITLTPVDWRFEVGV